MMKMKCIQTTFKSKFKILNIRRTWHLQLWLSSQFIIRISYWHHHVQVLSFILRCAGIKPQIRYKNFDISNTGTVRTSKGLEFRKKVFWKKKPNKKRNTLSYRWITYIYLAIVITIKVIVSHSSVVLRSTSDLRPTKRHDPYHDQLIQAIVECKLST